MIHPNEIQNSLSEFRKDHPNPNRTAFLIMRFRDKPIYNKIVSELKMIFENNRITLLRADDKEYHSDLFLNLQTYMHGCGIGVAVLDRIQEDDFNPNVSFEIGYMMSLFKPVLLLKDETIKTMQADLMGKLYKSFDPHSLEDTIKHSTQKWIQDKGLCYSCFEFIVNVKTPISDIVNNKEDFDHLISDLSIHSPTKPPRFKGLETSLDGESTNIVFEGDVDCYEHLKRLFISNHLISKSSIQISDVTTRGNEDNWGNEGLIPMSNNNVGQLCRLSGIEGHFEAIEASQRIIGSNIVHKVSECSVCISLDQDSILLVSNLVNFKCLYPTKFIIPTWMDENKLVKVYDALVNIAAGPGLSVYPSIDEITIAHFHKVKYYIDKRLMSEDFKCMLSLDGARNVNYY